MRNFPHTTIRKYPYNLLGEFPIALAIYPEDSSASALFFRPPAKKSGRRTTRELFADVVKSLPGQIERIVSLTLRLL
jgi:hypothetical protein